MTDQPNEVIEKAKYDSVLFPLITLIIYFAYFRLGALLIIIGLITGPKRGFFAIMFFFLVLPSLIMFMLIKMGFIDFSIF